MSKRKSAKHKLVEGHNEGKNYGFDYIDGDVYICDALAAPMNDALLDQSSIRNLIKHIFDHAQTQEKAIEIRMTDWWKRVREELSEHFSQEDLAHMEYVSTYKRISFKKPEPKDK